MVSAASSMQRLATDNSLTRFHHQILKDTARWSSLRSCLSAVLKYKQRLSKVLNTQIFSFTTSVTLCCLAKHTALSQPWPYNLLYEQLFLFGELLESSSRRRRPTPHLSLFSDVLTSYELFMDMAVFDTLTGLSRWKSPGAVYCEGQEKVHACTDCTPFSSFRFPRRTCLTREKRHRILELQAYTAVAPNAEDHVCDPLSPEERNTRACTCRKLLPEVGLISKRVG